jgi:hypothetical protein
MSFGSNGVDRVRLLPKNSDATLLLRTCALMAPVRPVLHRLLWSNETVRNAPKFRHDFVNELVGYWHQFGQFCIDFGVVTKRSEMPKNISFASTGVDWVRSLQKIPTRHCLAYLGANGTSSACFASTFLE